MIASAPYDARAVANFLLDLADERASTLSQMSLLKIIYFAHGWYLASHSAPLIKNQFEAWQYGPVVKVVRDAFKEADASPIRSRATRLVLYTGVHELVEADLAPDDAKFVTTIYDEYSSFNAWQLSEMTHEPGSPWYRLWHSENVVGRIGLRIKNEEILAHFASIRRRVRLS